MINEIQQTFLEKYSNYRGDIYRALEELGLSYFHFDAWKSNEEFDQIYNNYTRSIITTIKNESYLYALKKINDIVKFGTIETKETSIHKTDHNGSSATFKREVKKADASTAVLKMAVQESSIIQAIYQLSNEGVLPSTTAKKILQRSETITEEISRTLSSDSGGDELDEQKAIAIVRKAIVGANEIS